MKILSDEESRSADREMYNGRQTLRPSLNHVCHSPRERDASSQRGLRLLLLDVFETLYPLFIYSHSLNILRLYLCVCVRTVSCRI